MVGSTGSVSLYTVQGTDTVPFDTCLAHLSGIVPVLYFSTGLVTGSGTAGTDTLCQGELKTVSFIIERYCFGVGSVSLLYRVSITFALVNVFLYTVMVSFTYCFSTSLQSSCHVCVRDIYYCRLVQKCIWYQLFTVLK